MNIREDLLTRQDVREMTGWSLVFIDKHLPRFKVGGKVFFRAEAVKALLSGPNGNPLFHGEASPFALGLIFQWQQGSPYAPNSPEWKHFGRRLVNAFRDHLVATDQIEIITTMEAALSWSKTGEGQDFFDKHIPSPGRQRRFAVYTQ